MRSSRHVVDEEEIFFVEADGRQIVYVPLRGTVMEVNSTAGHALLPGGSETDRAKILREITNCISSSPKAQLGKDLSRSDGFSPYAVGLCLTNTCSLACAYCHADSGPAGSVFLPVEVGKAAVCLAYCNAVAAQKCLELSFPGTGEPTEAWSSMSQLVTYVESLTRDHKPGHKISMSTNGVFSREKAEFLTDHFSGISLSMDGPPDIQNAHRPSANGSPTFDAVFATAAYFYEKQFLFSIRTTVSELSVNRMSEIWDFFEEHFPGVPVGFERMNPLGRGCTSAIKPPSACDFDRNFEGLLREADRHKGLLLNSGVGKLNLLQSAFCKSLSYPCMTITPDGRVTACTRDGAPEYFHYGRWNAGTQTFDVDMDKVKQFRAMTVDTFPECQDCFSKYHCAGDCYDLRRAGIRRCSTNKRMIVLDLAHKLDHDRSITSVTPADPRYLAISRKLHHR